MILTTIKQKAIVYKFIDKDLKEIDKKAKDLGNKLMNSQYNLKNMDTAGCYERAYSGVVGEYIAKKTIPGLEDKKGIGWSADLIYKDMNFQVKNCSPTYMTNTYEWSWLINTADEAFTKLNHWVLLTATPKDIDWGICIGFIEPDKIKFSGNSLKQNPNKKEFTYLGNKDNIIHLRDLI